MILKKMLLFTLFPVFSLICVLHLTSAGAAVWEAAHPAGSFLELVAFNYDYDPVSNKVTMTYQYKNVSGSTITNPRVVNLFLWSNDICSSSWDTMTYGGSGNFASLYQSSTSNAYDGLFNWNATISSPAPPLNSTGMFPALPTQSTQNGVSYPYFNICTETAGTWANDEVITFSTSWNVSNPYWVQSESVVVSCEGGDCPAFPTFDADSDSITACNDTCPSTPNGPILGKCAKSLSGLTVATSTTCTNNGQCSGGFCLLNQQPEACICHSNITGDSKVDLADLVILKAQFSKPCPPSPCSADITGDSKVDLSDLVILKAEFLRTNCTS